MTLTATQTGSGWDVDETTGGSRDGTHASGPLHAGVAAVMKSRLPALCGF